MRLPKLHRIVACVALVAFCLMTGVKSLHHHSVDDSHEILCVLDGEDLCHCTHHDHTSVIPECSDDDRNCPICHFQIAKVLPLILSAWQTPELVFLKQSIYTTHIPEIEVVSNGSRAPPVG